jgi:ParB-like chromosome segregation protein Spo0J
VFDTLAYAKKLQAAGVSERIAEVHAKALAEVVEEKLATKSDINRLEGKIESDINRLESSIGNVRQELQSDIADVRKDMTALEERLTFKIEKVTYQLTIRLGSLLAAGILLIGSLHKLFN